MPNIKPWHLQSHSLALSQPHSSSSRPLTDSQSSPSQSCIVAASLSAVSPACRRILPRILPAIHPDSCIAHFYPLPTATSIVLVTRESSVCCACMMTWGRCKTRNPCWPARAAEKAGERMGWSLDEAERVPVIMLPDIFFRDLELLT